MRTCLGCRQRRPKRSLLRLARGADGVVTVDEDRRAAGRGAYVCPDARCAEGALRGGRLAHTLRRPCRVDAALMERVLNAALSAGR